LSYAGDCVILMYPLYCTRQFVSPGRANMRLYTSLRQFPLLNLAALSLLAVVTLLASPVLAADGSSIEEIRERINENGWNFEVDDSFVGTLTPEELEARKGFVLPEDYDAEFKANLKIYPLDKDPLPSRLDWRDVDGVTMVKNQGSCGSCWAFAAVAQLEAHIKIKYGVVTDLSEQQIISCNPYGSDCGGGWATAAYFVMEHEGVLLEGCGPYLSASPPEAPCIQDGIDKYGEITGYHYVSNDVEQIKAALQDGPVYTAIDASPEFDAYSGGCYDVPGHGTNHAVLIVGYDDRGCDEVGYWIIKNSWGTSFGESGYIFVQYGAGSVGTSAAQLHYTAPEVGVSVSSSLAEMPLISGDEVEINWGTSGPVVDNVDIYLSVDAGCLDIPVGLDVPNNGSYMWTVPNMSTDFGSLVIYPSAGGSTQGYGFVDGFINILGHKMRYVSATGDNTPPYESPGTAARTITDAINACTGVDTIMVTMGDYAGSINVTKPVNIFGGYNGDFSVRDADLYPTRVQSGTTGMRFFAGSMDHGGVDGITFHDCIGGIFGEPVSGNHGGAILCFESGPTINDCQFENNRAAVGGQTGYGGAVSVVRGNPVISNCDFTGNIATKGGAISVAGAGTTTIQDCNFTANSCSDSMAVNQGAAIYVEEGGLVFNEGLIRNNGGSGHGGALALVNGTAAFSRVAIEGNRSLLDGGAIFTEGGELSLANLNVSGNSSASGNGGAIAGNQSAWDVKNVHVSGNTAGNFGGGLLGFTVSGDIENNLIEGNGAPNGGGLVLMGSDPVMVRNNIITGNSGGGVLLSGEAINADYNCIVENVGGDYLAGTPGAHDVSLNPLLADPSVGDFALAVYSPCIDAGDVDASCADPDVSRADIGLLGGPGADFVAPAAVTGAALVELGGSEIRLDWDANTEPGITHYVVYRDTAAVFVPTDSRSVGMVVHPETSFTDTPIHEGTYYLVVAVDDMNHSGGYSVRMDASGGATPAGDTLVPTALAFDGVAPNPFNPMTYISYAVPAAGRVQIVVYDVRGRAVRALLDGQVEAGYHKVSWDGRNDQGQGAAAGVYFARIANGQSSDTVKMVLAK
jgi:hypothetical protein